MGTMVEKEYVICGTCGFRFERSKEYKHCSNCFACTGCEIYYCPRCDEEIVVTPIKKMREDPEIRGSSV
jgi:hypothetical protein